MHMLDKFYSKLSPQMNAEIHSGRAFRKTKTDSKPAKDVGNSTVTDKAFKMLFCKTRSNTGPQKRLHIVVVAE
jgi:hypothetical protein